MIILRRFFICTLLFASVKAAHPQSLTVSAAASLQDVLLVAGKNFQRQSGAKIHFNFASSGTLQHQIENGAPVDVYLSADNKRMNALEKQHFIVAGTRRVLARNSLVLIVPRASHSNVKSFRGLVAPSVRRIAIGGLGVPAGDRAREVFSRIFAKGSQRATIVKKSVQCRDVRAVLAQVELGNVDAGIVYASDALSTQRVRAVSTAPSTLHQPIRYPAAVVSRSKNQRLARRFIDYLASKRVQPLWKKYGFQTAK